MSMFYHEEVPAKRRKCLASALKNAFSKCHFSKGKLSYYSSHPHPHPQEPATDFDHQDEVFVSAVVSKYMESKSRRESSSTIGLNRLFDFFDLEYSVEFGICISSDDDDDDAFVSAKTCFSSLSSIDFKEDVFINDHEINDMIRKRWVIMDYFIKCEGWPFGLCRKALLLPPLPKSPLDSWSWINHQQKSLT